MRPPPEAEISAPEFPGELEWLNVAPMRMNRLFARGAVLIEFWDMGRVNSLRTLPYVAAWHERYSEAGLRVIGVHSPGYSFGRDPAAVEAAVTQLGISHAVVLDPELLVWRLYGNRGWPARYLFDSRGVLREFHYGEGDYRGSERAIQEVLLEIDPGLQLPDPMAALRPEDAPDARLEPQTADVSLPAERERVALEGEWVEGEDHLEAAAPGARASVEWTGSGCFAVVSGLPEPGPRECDGTVTAEAPGLRLHGFQFTPALAR